AGGIGELSQRAYDRPAEEPREDRHDRESEEGEDQEPLPQGGDRIVDRRLRRDDDQGERRARLEDRGGHGAVAAVAEVRVTRLGERGDLRPDDVARTGQDLAALREQDSVGSSEARRG